jgi:V8-like Glu-specific endopeptidase
LKAINQWAAASTIALALVLTGGAAAQAAPASQDAGNSGSVARTSTGKPVTDAAAAADVAAYWTEERMANAVDMDLVRPDTGKQPHRAAKPNGPAGSLPPAAPTVPSAKDVTIQLNESPIVGKVFLTWPGRGNGSCSASAINSGKKRLVITAGHCVHGGRGGPWFTNWQFVPRYRSGVRPFGTWSARQLTARTAWINDSNSDEDMGIAIMNNNGANQRIVDVVGGHGLHWNFGYNTFVTILGYPAEPPFTGELQYFCQGNTWNGHGQQVRAWCNMTGGSSGGPWLHDYNDANGLGYVNSVVSHRHGDPAQMDGPYFDNDIKGLFDFAESLSP